MSVSTRFQKLCVIGRGSYGTVFLAKNDKGKYVVLKEINLPPEYAQNLPNDAVKDTPVTAAVRETQLLQSLSHPNVIRVYGAFASAHGGVNIVMELIRGGDMAQRIAHRTALREQFIQQWRAKQVALASTNGVTNSSSPPPQNNSDNTPMNPQNSENTTTTVASTALANAIPPLSSLRPFHFSERRVVHWATGICLALSYLHAKHIIHRDIKTANVLLTSDHEVKLADFGVARKMDRTLDNAKTQCGTPFYLSPEVCKSEQYDHKSDIWALGVVLYELAALKRPFHADNILTLVRRIVVDGHTSLNDVFPGLYSEELSQLIDLMLAKQPQRRPDVHQCLAVLRRLEGRVQWGDDESVDREPLWERDSAKYLPYLPLINRDETDKPADFMAYVDGIMGNGAGLSTAPGHDGDNGYGYDGKNGHMEEIKVEIPEATPAENADYAESSLSFDSDPPMIAASLPPAQQQQQYQYQPQQHQQQQQQDQQQVSIPAPTHADNHASSTGTSTGAEEGQETSLASLMATLTLQHDAILPPNAYPVNPDGKTSEIPDPGCEAIPSGEAEDTLTPLRDGPLCNHLSPSHVPLSANTPISSPLSPPSSSSSASAYVKQGLQPPRPLAVHVTPESSHASPAILPATAPTSALSPAHPGYPASTATSTTAAVSNAAPGITSSSGNSGHDSGTAPPLPSYPSSSSAPHPAGSFPRPPLSTTSSLAPSPSASLSPTSLTHTPSSPLVQFPGQTAVPVQTLAAHVKTTSSRASSAPVPASGLGPVPVTVPASATTTGDSGFTSPSTTPIHGMGSLVPVPPSTARPAHVPRRPLSGNRQGSGQMIARQIPSTSSTTSTSSNGFPHAHSSNPSTGAHANVHVGSGANGVGGVEEEDAIVMPREGSAGTTVTTRSNGSGHSNNGTYGGPILGNNPYSGNSGHNVPTPDGYVRREGEIPRTPISQRVLPNRNSASPENPQHSGMNISGNRVSSANRRARNEEGFYPTRIPSASNSHNSTSTGTGTGTGMGMFGEDVLPPLSHPAEGEASFTAYTREMREQAGMGMGMGVGVGGRLANGRVPSPMKVDMRDNGRDGRVGVSVRVRSASSSGNTGVDMNLSTGAHGNGYGYGYINTPSSPHSATNMSMGAGTGMGMGMGMGMGTGNGDSTPTAMNHTNSMGLGNAGMGNSNAGVSREEILRRRRLEEARKREQELNMAIRTTSQNSKHEQMMNRQKNIDGSGLFTGNSGNSGNGGNYGYGYDHGYVGDDHTQQQLPQPCPQTGNAPNMGIGNTSMSNGYATPRRPRSGGMGEDRALHLAHHDRALVHHGAAIANQMNGYNNGTGSGMGTGTGAGHGYVTPRQTPRQQSYTRNTNDVYNGNHVQTPQKYPNYENYGSRGQNIDAIPYNNGYNSGNSAMRGDNFRNDAFTHSYSQSQSRPGSGNILNMSNSGNTNSHSISSLPSSSMSTLPSSGTLTSTIAQTASAMGLGMRPDSGNTVSNTNGGNPSHGPGIGNNAIGNNAIGNNGLGNGGERRRAFSHTQQQHQQHSQGMQGVDLNISATSHHTNTHPHQHPHSYAHQHHQGYPQGNMAGSNPGNNYYSHQPSPKAGYAPVLRPNSANRRVQ